MLQPSQSIVIGESSQSRGIKINYTASLKNANAATLVLIHGFGASLETWNDIYSDLTPSYSVIKLDLKGAGFSDKPRDGKYSPLDQAELLLSFLEAMGQKEVVLAGHSLGGAVALIAHFQSRHRKSNLIVKGLVLIDSAGYIQQLPFFVSGSRNPFTSALLRIIPAYFKAKYVLNQIITVKSKVTHDRICRYAFFLNHPNVRYAMQQTALQIIPNNAENIVAQIASIKIPTLVIWGQNDPVIPLANAYRFHSEIQNSTIKILPETGHIPQEERPKETYLALEKFLQTLN